MAFDFEQKLQETILNNQGGLPPAFENNAVAEQVWGQLQHEPTEVKPEEKVVQFTQKLKEKEEAQLIELIEKDQAEGTIRPEEAEDLKRLAHQGRLIVYSVSEGGAFDGYISKDELEQLQTEPQALTTEIYLMNPTWSNGTSKITLGNLAPCFDRKEMVTLVDHVEANGIQVENVQYDEQARTVMGEVKNGQGKFHVRVSLDDGTHRAPVYDFADQQGQVAHVPENQLHQLTGLDQGMDIKALQARMEADQNADGVSRLNAGAGAVSPNRLAALENLLGLGDIDINLKLKFQEPAPLSAGMREVINSRPRHHTNAPTSSQQGAAPRQFAGGMSSSRPSSGGGSSEMPPSGNAGEPKQIIKSPKANEPQTEAAKQIKKDQEKTRQAIQAQGEKAQEAMQPPPRYSGIKATMGGNKSGLKKKIAAAAVLTGGTAVAIPSIVGISSVFMEDTTGEAISFVHNATHTIFSFFV